MFEEKQHENVMIKRQQFRVQKRRLKHKSMFVVFSGILLVVATLLGVDLALLVMAYSGAKEQSHSIGDIVAKVVALLILEIEIMKQTAQMRKKSRYRKYYSFALKKGFILFLNTAVSIGLICWIIIPNERYTSFLDFMSRKSLLVAVAFAVQALVIVLVGYIKTKYLPWFAD
ncbi:hypothetical protein [Leuconostoc mesenteroides]|uniref:hypothetical protein n=1 Tax=Leuconostoc mesenteroides TaxID=1245 RepID=UPI00235F5E70|nr:hypothetical protein [Leuconostoc mesenteroides]